MNQQVKKWGNSLALRIPAALGVALDLKEDDAIDMREENGRLVIEKKRRRYPTLEEMIAGITPENIHPETDWGSPVGKEIW